MAVWLRVRQIRYLFIMALSIYPEAMQYILPMVIIHIENGSGGSVQSISVYNGSIYTIGNDGNDPTIACYWLGNNETILGNGARICYSNCCFTKCETRLIKGDDL